MCVCVLNVILRIKYNFAGDYNLLGYKNIIRAFKINIVIKIYNMKMLFHKYYIYFV